jgi:serine/alanine adding enzyme
MNEDVIATLKKCGAVHKGYTVRIEESTQPRFNAEMDVTEDYREHLEHKTAKCIRAAEHKGIEVYEGPQYIHDFGIAMHYTEVRKQVASAK